MFIFLQQNDLYVRYLHMICKSFDVMKGYFVFIIILRYDASKDKERKTNSELSCAPIYFRVGYKGQGKSFS